MTGSLGIGLEGESARSFAKCADAGPNSPRSPNVILEEIAKIAFGPYPRAKWEKLAAIRNALDLAGVS